MNIPAHDIVDPPVPRNLDDIGISPVMMRDLVLKTMFRAHVDTAAALAHLLCLPLTLTQDLIEQLRAQNLIEAAGTLHAGGGSDMPYRLTDQGKARALDALAQSEYFGAVPVPLAQWRAQVARQSIRNIRLTPERLTQAMRHLIVPPTLLGQLGPAISSGRSILLYGPPGNGKSALSNSIRDAIGDRIHIPHAVEYAGQIITVHDPIIHTGGIETPDHPGTLRRSPRGDRRYVLCDRPTVITGGELTLDRLDLSFNPASRIYTAPLQMKAAGGVFIVDDLGRQADPPQKIINRWIVPLEEGRDILSLQSGEKFEVPFDTLVLFSTNFHPNRIFDQAALRRIFFKIRIDGPSPADFLRIFAMVARRKQFPIDEATLKYLIREKYPAIGNVFANYQPGFLIDQMIAVCDFEGLPRGMTPALIDRAWENMFVREDGTVAH